jgi:hypothetical protein
LVGFTRITSSRSSTGASIQTSGRITWPQNPAGSGTITISYALNLPAGTTISNVGLNGEWGNSGSWSGPVISGSTITYTVTTDTSPADMCGGISFDLNNFASPKTATIDPTITFGSVPAGCAPNDGTTYTFERNVDPNIANYGATANCQDSAVWV